jgi:hypothetical protein
MLLVNPVKRGIVNACTAVREKLLLVKLLYALHRSWCLFICVTFINRETSGDGGVRPYKKNCESPNQAKKPESL